MDNQAVRPSFYKEFITEVNETLNDEPKDENTQALSYITHFRGWQLMKEYQAKLVEMLDNGFKEAIAQGATMKEIGERALVKELAEFVLNQFVEKAESARRLTDE